MLCLTVSVKWINLVRKFSVRLSDVKRLSDSGKNVYRPLPPPPLFFRLKKVFLSPIQEQINPSFPLLCFAVSKLFFGVTDYNLNTGFVMKAELLASKRNMKFYHDRTIFLPAPFLSLHLLFLSLSRSHSPFFWFIRNHTFWHADDTSAPINRCKVKALQNLTAAIVIYFYENFLNNLFC